MKMPDWFHKLPDCPSWFPSTMTEIDPAMYLEYNRHSNCYELKKRILIKLPMREWIREPWTLAVFERLNDSSMTHIRYLHWLYNKLNLRNNPVNYYKWLKKLNDEAKQKEHELAVEQIAEGFMRIHNLERKKMFT